MYIRPSTLLFLCFFTLIFYRLAHANLVDELLLIQERNEKINEKTMLEKRISDRRVLLNNCKLPFANQKQLIEDVANFANVDPMSVRVISAELRGVDQYQYCRAHVYHGKGTCFIGVNFDKNGFLTSSIQQLRNGQCNF